ncbi:MAG: AraC family transcriptional regulator [Gemmatimonadaceae bacterium]|jgi:AraC family transcriptional regulator|nr:AraC family transcriptional regulator [Gemmatimonadaceae bacterium]
MTGSAVPFLDGRSRERVDALGEAETLVSSAGLAWPGLLVELGRNGAWEVDDLTVADHYLALNVNDAPLTFEARVDGRFRTVALEPGGAWFCPAGESFSHRVPGPSRYALVTLSDARLRSLLPGTPPELARSYALDAPQLHHLVQSLVVEADRRNPGGVLFVDAVAAAVAQTIVTTTRVENAPAPVARGGLAGHVRTRVLDLIEARLGSGVSADELAREAGLSVAHFARAFRTSVGMPPHQYLMQRRLEAARRALELPGAVLSEVAFRHGFADQAHFGRAFRKAFGVTPGSVRARR